MGKFENAEVIKNNEGYHITWQGQGLSEVAITWSEDPDFTAAQGASVTGSVTQTAEGGSCDVVWQDACERPYFLLTDTSGCQIRTAVRLLPLEGIVNFRDIGGYLAADGRRVRWGKLLRSAAHDALTDKDEALLKKIGLKTVVDYRSTKESTDRPDKQVDGITYLSLKPLAEGANATNILHIKMDTPEDAIAGLTAVNRQLVVEPQALAAYQKMVRTVLNPEQVPMVQHCTAGKDRVGLGISILLLALGVPEETIVADYLLSNQNQIKQDALSSKVVEVSEEQQKQQAIFAVLTQVRREYLQAAFDSMREHYGSPEQYLRQGLGLTDEELTRLKDMYLEAL